MQASDTAISGVDHAPWLWRDWSRVEPLGSPCPSGAESHDNLVPPPAACSARKHTLIGLWRPL
jgi:hypothetical protein